MAAVARSVVRSADLVSKAVVYAEAAGKDLAAAVAVAARVAAARVADTCERNPFHPLPIFGCSPNRPAAPCRTDSSSRLPSNCSCSVKPAAVAMEAEEKMEIEMEIAFSVSFSSLSPRQVIRQADERGCRQISSLKCGA